jgi:hypothetical protein
VAERGSPFFSESVSQHRLVEGQIGDHTLEPPILLAELLQLPQLADVEDLLRLDLLFRIPASSRPRVWPRVFTLSKRDAARTQIRGPTPSE